MQTYLFISEGLLAATAILFWASAMVFSSRLTFKLKQDHPDRYSELTGAKRAGNGWAGEARTSKAFSYLFTDLDDQIPEIRDLKGKVKRGIWLASLCAAGFLINGLVTVLTNLK